MARPSAWKSVHTSCRLAASVVALKICETNMNDTREMENIFRFIRPKSQLLAKTTVSEIINPEKSFREVCTTPHHCAERRFQSACGRFHWLGGTSCTNNRLIYEIVTNFLAPVLQLCGTKTLAGVYGCLVPGPQSIGRCLLAS